MIGEQQATGGGLYWRVLRMCLRSACERFYVWTLRVGSKKEKTGNKMDYRGGGVDKLLEMVVLRGRRDEGETGTVGNDRPYVSRLLRPSLLRVLLEGGLRKRRVTPRAGDSTATEKAAERGAAPAHVSTCTHREPLPYPREASAPYGPISRVPSWLTYRLLLA